MAGSGAHMIGLGQGTAPGFGDDFSLERRQQRLRVGVGNGQDGNFGDGLCIFQIEPLRVFRGADAGGERIARIKRHIHHAAALHAVARTPGTVGENVALRVAIVRGIGIDEASDRAMLGRNLGLDAAPGISIARDGNGSLDRDPHARQFFVVIRSAVVDINQRRGDVAVGRVGVVGGKLFGLLVGGRIDGQRRLLQFGGEFRGLEQFDDAHFRRGKQHVESFNAGVEPPLLEFGQHPFRVVLVIGRTHMVGAGGEALHVVALVLGLGDGSELRFPIALDPGGSRGIAVQRLFGVGRCGEKQATTKS